jgi:Peptidase family M1 domain
MISSRTVSQRLRQPAWWVLVAALAVAAARAQPRKQPAEPLPGAKIGPPAEGVQEPGRSAPTAPLASERTKPEAVSPDGIEVAGWDAGATRVESRADAWGGERQSFGGDGAPLSQRVASYLLEAVLDPVKHTVEGKEHLDWTNRSARPVRSLYFHLYLNGFEGPGSTFLSELLRYGQFREGIELKQGEWGYIELRAVRQAGRSAAWAFVHPDGGPATDHSVVRVDLPEPVAPGATATLDIEFHDQLPRVIARTGYFKQYHLVAQWFPKVGVLELPGERGATAPRWNCHEFHVHSEFYADFGNYEGVITAPPDYLVRATGEEQGPPLMTAQGLAHRFRQDDVHDFVFTAWNRFEKPLTGVYEGPGSPKVQVEVLYPAEYAESARVALKATLDALKNFSETLGPYPYRHVTCVVPPFNATESGGMEYETFFTTIGTSARALKPLIRYVTVHEFGHGYFMGLLASNEFEEPFLDEGMNELWDLRMLSSEAIDFDLPPLARTLGLRVPPISYFDFERSRGTQRFMADPIAGNSWNRYSSGSYGLVYSRTVLVFHDLEGQLGEEAFARGMKLYYRRWHHRHPGTADLKAALAEASGQKELVDRWFDAQVYDISPIDDRVTELQSDEVVPRPGYVERGGKRVELTEAAVKKEIQVAREAWKKEHGDRQDEKAPGPFPYSTAVTARRYEAHVPQILVVRFADGSEEQLRWPAGERWHRWVLVKPVRAVSAQLDPRGMFALDLNKLDDGRLAEASHLASRRWAFEAHAFLSLVFSLLVTR